MKNKMEWSPEAAQSSWELLDVLFFAAAGLKTQILKSPVLQDSNSLDLKSRLSGIETMIRVLQADIVPGK